MFVFDLFTGPPSDETTAESTDAPKTELVQLNGATQKTIVTMQQHKQQQQQQQATIQPQQHSNIILVRGTRNENGQIVLQNSHELLNLLNDEDSPLLLQHPRIKAKPQRPSETTYMLQPALRATGNQLDGTVLLQSTTTVKKGNTLPEGSIIVQQRMNKNGTADGPILLQTLKRLDKSQSILVFRNPNSTSTASTITTNTSTSRIKTTAAAIEDITDKSEKHQKPSTATPTSKPLNTPLGSGKYL